MSGVLYLNLNTFAANVHIPVCSSFSDEMFRKLFKHADFDFTDGLLITVGLEEFFLMLLSSCNIMSTIESLYITQCNILSCHHPKISEPDSHGFKLLKT